MKRAALPFVLLGLLAACDEAGPNISGIDPIAIARIEVAPALDTMYVGDTASAAAPRQYEATVIGRTGAPLDIRLAWFSRDEAVATVDEDGVVRAVAPGTARIVASAGKQGEAVLVVLQEVAAVAIGPAAPRGAVGEELPLEALALGPDGEPVLGVAWAWSSSNPAVATVDGRGVAQLRSAGETTITLTGGGRSTQARLVVE